MGRGRGPRIPGQKFLTNEGTRSSYVTSPRKFKWANQDEAAKAGSDRPITWQCPRKQGYKGTSPGLLSFTRSFKTAYQPPPLTRPKKPQELSTAGCGEEAGQQSCHKGKKIQFHSEINLLFLHS